MQENGQILKWLFDYFKAQSKGTSRKTKTTVINDCMHKDVHGKWQLVLVLDEPTSAVEPAFEAQIFAELAASRVTLLTVAHRPELAAYHTHELRLDGDGGSSFEIVSSG